MVSFNGYKGVLQNTESKYDLKLKHIQIVFRFTYLYRIEDESIW